MEVVQHQITLPGLSHLSNKGEDPVSLVLGPEGQEETGETAAEEGHLLCMGKPRPDQEDEASTSG